VTNFAGNSEKTCPGIFIRALEPIGVFFAIGIGHG